jgi:hypothetical protein
MKKIFYSCLLLLVLSSCTSSMKRKIGLTKKAPDEFMVVSQPDLVTPPNFDLVDPEFPINPYYNEDKQNDNNISLEKEDMNFLSRLPIKKSDKNIRSILSKNNDYTDYTEEKNILTKTKEVLIDKSEMIEENVEHVIIPVEEKNRIENNKKKNLPITDGEVKTKKKRSSLLERIFGKNE